ncbi:hypothetical protein LguiB_026633 [Lonicera macranthoides]
MDIPEGVKIKVKAKMIEVEGPKGPRDNGPHLSDHPEPEMELIGKCVAAA